MPAFLEVPGWQKNGTGNELQPLPPTPDMKICLENHISPPIEYFHTRCCVKHSLCIHLFNSQTSSLRWRQFLTTHVSDKVTRLREFSSQGQSHITSDRQDKLWIPITGLSNYILRMTILTWILTGFSFYYTGASTAPPPPRLPLPPPPSVPVPACVHHRAFMSPLHMEKLQDSRGTHTQV